MARANLIFTDLALTLFLLTLFTSSALANGTGLPPSTTTVVVNGTFSTHPPTATSTQNPSTPSSLVSGSSTIDPLAQMLLLIATGVFGTFAFGL